METKVCTKCGRELPLSEFGKHRITKDGLSYWCKECSKQDNLQRSQRDKEKRKKYRQEHKEEKLKYVKKYYKTLNGYCSHIKSAYIQEDKKHGRIVETLPDDYITLEYFMDAIKQPCFYCKEHKSFNEMGLDRIDNSKPHTIDNVVPCCTECNKKRGKKTYEEFLEIIKIP